MVRASIGPLVRGFSRLPASRRIGSDTAAIDGRFSRPITAISSRSRDSTMSGVGSASRICGMGAGGVR
ncbi:MAG: hypothetical protein K0R83_2068 [Caulobacter sp.]|nr:hypothetical protein [Caulobacter sp.]